MKTTDAHITEDDGALGGELSPRRPVRSAATAELGSGTSYRLVSSSRPEVRAGDVLIRG